MEQFTEAGVLFRTACIKFSNKLSECVELMGKTPSSIAAVVILKVTDGSISKQDISKRCSVSLPTLNKIDIIVQGSDYKKRKFKNKSITFNRTKNISSSIILY